MGMRREMRWIYDSGAHLLISWKEKSFMMTHCIG